MDMSSVPGWEGSMCAVRNVRDRWSMSLIGQRVHYVSYGTPIREDGTQAYTSQCRAAIITEVAEGFDESAMLGLCVLNPSGMFFHPLDDDGCVIDKGSELSGRATWSCDGYDHLGGTWHFPGDVEPEEWSGKRLNQPH